MFLCDVIPDADDREFILWMYEEFRNLMFFTARQYFQDQMICEDMVQECLLRLIQKADVLRGKERSILAGYIISVIRNVSLNYLKREQKRNERSIGCDEQTTDQIPSDELSAEELLLAKENAGFLFSVLKQLPESERLLLEGKYLLEYSNEELAGQLNCKPDSIRMKLTRARRHALALLQQADEKGEDENDRRIQPAAGTI